MAEIVLRPDSVGFPIATTVKVFARPWPPPGGNLTGEPTGAVVDEPEVDENGELHVAGVNEGASYVGYAVTEEVDRYVFFSLPPPSESSLAGTIAGELEAIEAVEGKTAAGEPAPEARTEGAGTSARARGRLKQSAAWAEGDTLATLPGPAHPAHAQSVAVHALGSDGKSGLAVLLTLGTDGTLKVAAGGAYPSTGRLLVLDGLSWAL